MTFYIIAGLMIASGCAFGYIVHRFMKSQVDAQKALAKAAMEEAEQVHKDHEFTKELEAARKAREIESRKGQQAEIAKIESGDRNVFDKETF